MKFYRTLTPFKLMSFDLDDTLYDNSQVIQDAEDQFIRHFVEITGISLSREEWQNWCMKISAQNPILCEDVTRRRQEAVHQFLQNHHKSAVEIEQIWQQLLAHFLDWRHKIAISAETREILTALKRRYPLVAITNGNVDPKRIGLHFDLTLTGGVQGRAKPHADLFQQTAAKFHLKPQEILHVGDNLVTDVQGAIQAGCQAAWLNLSNKTLAQCPEATLLPTLEIHQLKQLLSL
ncbi:putative hydrolase of the HAD superfamily [Pasteurella langaaensis DSM 22999]|uniref:Putative hydrolase of the HAD superfamily n=1 Tax=Alitibacter langaaensis DSM 22999 TaxID=1122935 RepID=A0A2U0TCU1_9PAST|nr:HAD-IA family hydrolase [Pasteurella langaaensis]PVX41420.1 putative hydrolase of the HAD superfamily [Pasteurella langaaensis DSM 22999]